MGKAEALQLALRRGADALLAAILAPHCAACGSTLEEPTRGAVCAGCWGRVRLVSPPLCTLCGDPLPSWRTISMALERCPACRRQPPVVDRGRAAGDYEGALREIIHAFKYEGRRSLAAPLGRMMRDAGASLLCDASCVVPVPLHAWRRLGRGFNQAADLAHVLDVRVVPALWRSRVTRSQAGLTARERRRNVRGAFRLSPLLRGTARERLLSGATVVLVDDVRTTGATLDACARVLRSAGAREVRALTLARATLRRSGVGPI
jgi:ComF family protein